MYGCVLSLDAVERTVIRLPFFARRRLGWDVIFQQRMLLMLTGGVYALLEMSGRLGSRSEGGGLYLWGCNSIGELIGIHKLRYIASMLQCVINVLDVWPFSIRYGGLWCYSAPSCQ